MLAMILVLGGHLLVIPGMNCSAEEKNSLHQVCAFLSLVLGIIALNTPTDEQRF